MAQQKDLLTPSVFIMGAPKCGTTSLARYLEEHPALLLCNKFKEPNFFSFDLPKLQEVQTYEQYESLFVRNKPTQKISFEASTWYLYSSVAAKKITEYNQFAKFIVMLRNPIEMAQSLHSQQLYNLNETVEDFQDAWRESLEGKGERGALLDYSNNCSTGSQLERLLNEVDPKNVLVILFDELKTNPDAVLRKAQTFIGVYEIGLKHYDSFNSNKKVKSRSLQTFLYRTPKPIKGILNATKKVLGVKELGLSGRLKKLNTINAERQELDIVLKKELIDHFSDEISKIERFLNKDLSHWRKIK